MLELDLLLEPFVTEVFPTLQASEQAAYARLLECEDTELYQWLLFADPPAQFTDIVRLIQHHAQNTARP